MIRRMAAMMLIAAAVPAAAGANVVQDPPKRVRNATVYGDDPCPKPTDEDEVVVCGRLDESERYRIPKEFREAPDLSTGGQSWANRAETAMEVARIGTPNSCSVVGSGGQTGCTQAMLRQWFAERRQQRAIDSQVP